MAWLLFIDESGQDRRQSPYEVLAGLAVEDWRLWPLIVEIRRLQRRHFGIELFDAYGAEAKATKLLKTKVFRQASWSESIASAERSSLAHAALTKGETASRQALAALAQAKISYCEEALKLCRRAGCQAFASIIPKSTPRPKGDFLRKDYAYLFQRFHDLLDRSGPGQQGIVIFDELEKSESHILLGQMRRYFLETRTGMRRSSRIIPEPFFVHSDLTTLIQMVDLVAYVISWGVRIRGMSDPARDNLGTHASQVLQLRYRVSNPNGHDIWGFKLINSLTSTSPQ
ncbi:MAG: DUF3800 domain-containing protein [Azospirillaceae bacterium]